MHPGPSGEEPFDQFLDLWDRLCAASRSPGTVVVVEGERDRRALRRLGLPGSILLVHRGDSLATTAHRIARANRRVIVLTDWDGEGGVLARRLKEFLEAEPLDLDLEFRRRLARILRGELVHVEGLHGWARRSAEARGATLDHFLPEPDEPDPV